METEAIEATTNKAVTDTAEGQADPLVALRERQAGRAAQYWRAVRKLASGEKVPAAALEKLADGRGPERIEADARLARERLELRKTILAGAEAERRASDLRSALHAARARLAEAQREFAETERTLRARLSACRAASEQATAARERLIATCPDETLRRRLGELTTEREKLIERLGATSDPDVRIQLEQRAAELAEKIEATRQAMIAF